MVNEEIFSFRCFFEFFRNAITGGITKPNQVYESMTKLQIDYIVFSLF